MDRGWPVAITALGGASAATVAWRKGPQLFVTAIVKGRFTFVPGGSMASIAPEPIFVEEQEGKPGPGLSAADDLAPYLGHTDVSLTGHAPFPRSPTTPTVRVRLAILGKSTSLLDKSLDLEVPRGVPPRPIPIVGMGPISKQWPIRRRLLGAVDPRRLEGPILEIPASFDWRYFQASPSDQQIGPLRGDEWILLEGVHPTLEQLTTQLPGARAEARLHGQAPGHESIPLALDALRIDVERRRCSITWRGHFPVRGDLSSLQIDAGMELPGRPIHWPDPPRAAAPPPRPAIAARAEDDPLAGTLRMTEPLARPTAARAQEEQDPLARTIMMGDEPPAPAASATIDDPLAGTLGLREDTAAELAARPAIPFRSGLSSPQAIVSMPLRAAPVAAAEHDPLGGTLGLDEKTAAELAALPATPFGHPQVLLPQVPAAPVVPPEYDPLAGTLGLREDTAAELASRPATPFRAGLSSPLFLASTPSRAARAPRRDPLGSTLGLDELPAAALAAPPSTPFPQPRSMTRPPAPLSLDLHAGEEEENEEMPHSLGAQFLAAMAAIERKQSLGSEPRSD
jgi:hypothetical protein